MCLGVPGRVTRVTENDLGITMGTVDFGGISREVCLACVPEVVPGQYVIVHAGFAISRLSEEEAAETLALLERLGELPERDLPPPEA